MNRRDFLKASLAGAGAAAGVVAGSAADADARPATEAKAVLKLSSQENKVPGKDLGEKVRKLQDWGGVGVELFKQHMKDPKAVLAAIKGTSVKVSAICAGYFGLIDPDPAVREKGAAELKEIVAAAGEVGSTGVILVPAFNQHKQLHPKDARQVLLETLPAMGEHAAKAGTRILLEPLNRKEAFFLRMLADAASICRDVNSPGIGMMGDFYHMSIEETSDLGAFLSAGRYLHHVHLATGKSRIAPGQEGHEYVQGFGGLKRIGYQDYCSLECTVRGKPEEEIPKCFRFLEKQWEEAKA
jgi:sugar phosphate isomerase/epimerase